MPSQRSFIKVNVLDRIASILEDYPPMNHTLFKEMLQNAEDAKATQLHVVLDESSHASCDVPYNSTEPLTTEESNLRQNSLNQLCGPSIWFCNDKTFKKSDWNALTNIDSSSKREDDQKIGKYGIGFNVGHHYTDHPMILSDQELMIIDHTQRLLVDATYHKEENLQESELEPMTDWFKHENLSIPDGTIIRLPLRLSKDNKSMSRHQCSLQALEEELKDLCESCANMVLFLKHIQKITVTIIHPNGYIQKLFKLNIKDTQKSQQVKIRHVETTYYKYSLNGSDKLDTVFKEEELEYLEENIDYTKSVSKRDYFIVTCDITENPAIQTLLAKDRSSFLKAIPLVSIASLIPKEKHTYIKPNTDGKLYVFLPTEDVSPIPFYVHSYFAVASNRREIWKSRNDGRTDNSQINLDWNVALFRFGVTNCIVTLWKYLFNYYAKEDKMKIMQAMCKMVLLQSDIDSKLKIWKEFKEELCGEIMKQPLFVDSKGEFCSLSGNSEKYICSVERFEEQLTQSFVKDGMCFIPIEKSLAGALNLQLQTPLLLAIVHYRKQTLKKLISSHLASNAPLLKQFWSEIVNYFSKFNKIEGLPVLLSNNSVVKLSSSTLSISKSYYECLTKLISELQVSADCVGLSTTIHQDCYNCLLMECLPKYSFSAWKSVNFTTVENIVKFWKAFEKCNGNKADIASTSQLLVSDTNQFFSFKELNNFVLQTSTGTHLLQAIGKHILHNDLKQTIVKNWIETMHIDNIKNAITMLPQSKLTNLVRQDILNWTLSHWTHTRYCSYLQSMNLIEGFDKKYHSLNENLIVLQFDKVESILQQQFCIPYLNYFIPFQNSFYYHMPLSFQKFTTEVSLLKYLSSKSISSESQILSLITYFFTKYPRTCIEQFQHRYIWNSQFVSQLYHPALPCYELISICLPQSWCNNVTMLNALVAMGMKKTIDEKYLQDVCRIQNREAVKRKIPEVLRLFTDENVIFSSLTAWRNTPIIPCNGSLECINAVAFKQELIISSASLKQVTEQYEPLIRTVLRKFNITTNVTENIVKKELEAIKQGTVNHTLQKITACYQYLEDHDSKLDEIWYDSAVGYLPTSRVFLEMSQPVGPFYPVLDWQKPFKILFKFKAYPSLASIIQEVNKPSQVSMRISLIIFGLTVHKQDYNGPLLNQRKELKPISQLWINDSPLLKKEWSQLQSTSSADSSEIMKEWLLHNDLESAAQQYCPSLQHLSRSIVIHRKEFAEKSDDETTLIQWNRILHDAKFINALKRLILWTPESSNIAFQIQVSEMLSRVKQSVVKEIDAKFQTEMQFTPPNQQSSILLSKHTKQMYCNWIKNVFYIVKERPKYLLVEQLIAQEIQHQYSDWYDSSVNIQEMINACASNSLDAYLINNNVPLDMDVMNLGTIIKEEYKTTQCKSLSQLFEGLFVLYNKQFAKVKEVNRKEVILLLDATNNKSITLDENRCFFTVRIFGDLEYHKPQQIRDTKNEKQELTPALMIEELHEILNCSICRDTMQDPLILFPSGHTYDKHCWESWKNASRQRRCPLSGTHVTGEAKNVLVQQIQEKLAEWLVKLLK